MFFDLSCFIIKMMDQNRENEKGNALWFIMLAIALLAALSVAISRGSDTIEQNAEFERARIKASELLRYTKNIQEAINQMRMRNVSESDLCFDSPKWGHADYNYASCADSSNKVFDAAGGGIAFRTFPQASNWVFFGSHEISNLETSENELMVQAEINDVQVCEHINTLSGVSNPGGPPLETVFTPEKYTGAFTDASAGSGDNIIGNNAAQLDRKKIGCRQDNSVPTKYFMFHVLLAR
jgi:hypothetical protein